MKKNRFLISLMAFIGCNQPEAVQTFPITPINHDSEEGFEDVRLSVTEIERTEAYNIITALSTSGTDTVGLAVYLPTQKLGDKGFGEGLLMRSIGKASHNLLQELAKLYDTPLSPDAEFATFISARYVDLDEFALGVAGNNNKEEGLTKLKLFLDNDEGDTAEFYLNIHVDQHWLEIREKEDSFREAMIKLLQKG